MQKKGTHTIKIATKTKLDIIQKQLHRIKSKIALEENF